MKKTDCFAMARRRCVALIPANCENCAFYCSNDEMKRRQKEINKRLRGLDQSTQTYIASKYHGGRFTWHEGALV